MAKKNISVKKPLDRGKISLGYVELLYEVSRQFSSTLNLNEMLGRVLSMTVQAVGASVGSIFLLDSSGNVIRSILARGDLPPETKVPVLKTVMKQGFAGWIYKNKQADIISDTLVDNRWVIFPDDTLMVRSVIGIPLMRREQVIGILTISHPAKNEYQPWHLEILESIGQQAASAIENAALFTRANQERLMLQAIIESVDDIILVIDEHDRLLLANRSAIRKMGIDSDYRGKNVSQVISEQKLLEFYFSNKQKRNPDQETVFQDGRTFDCALIAIPKVGIMMSLHDITVLKELDRLKSDFVEQVSHDLKNPLMLIYGHTLLLEEMVQAETTVIVDKIRVGVSRMQDLIDTLLDLGKIEMGFESDFVDLNLVDIINACVAEQSDMADRNGVKLISWKQAEIAMVRGSAIRLNQAITNLIGNAIKFTPEGGRVRVNLKLNPDDVVVQVIDTGPGIPPAKLGTLFHKFSKTGTREIREKEGHGLGLAIVKSVMDGHGGRVWVESTVSHGSTFSLALSLVG
jgi:PAS domain S-box-containing protein